MATLTDGGNTDKTISQIVNVEQGEEIKLMNNLMNKSPYLSDTSLISTASQEDVLPDIIVATVLVANPQSSKSQAVQSALDNRQNPMPQYLREAINEGLNFVSDKEIIEN